MKMTNGTNPNNQVPKDTVDNIMKTYENIINQHLKSMEQISESVKNLHTTSYTIEKSMKDYIDNKIKEIYDKYEKSVEEKRKIVAKIEEDITGPTPETDTNLKGINENISFVGEEVKNLTRDVKSIKHRLVMFITIISAIMGIVSVVYLYVQKANDAFIKNSIKAAVVEIITTRPSNIVPQDFIIRFDKNKDGKIDKNELEEATQ